MGNLVKDGFASLSDDKQFYYMTKALEHLNNSGRSWSQDMYDQVVYITAVYLYQMDQYTAIRPEYPFYAVHSMDKDWRFEVKEFKDAFSMWKKGLKRGERCAIFYWRNRGICERTHASVDYAFDRDFGRRDGHGNH